MSEKKPQRKEAIYLAPLLYAVEDSVRRFRVIYGKHGDVSSAVIDLRMTIEDLEDAVDKNAEGR